MGSSSGYLVLRDSLLRSCDGYLLFDCNVALGILWGASLDCGCSGCAKVESLRARGVTAGGAQCVNFSRSLFSFEVALFKSANTLDIFG